MVLPGVAIASRRPVRSILLVSQVPVEKIRTVALDTSSMTSVALTKILFEKWLGGGRIYPDAARHRKNARRARCRIGDRRSRSADRPLALSHPRSCRRMDSLHRQALRLRLLGGSQRGVAGSHSGTRLAGNFSALPRPRTGTGQPRPHRREWAPRLGLSEADVRSYLTGNIYYHLDAACLEGLQLFYRYAAEIGALPPRRHSIF